MRCAQKLAARIENAHGISRLRLATVHHIACENPEMPGADAIRSLAIDSYGRQWHRLI